MIIKLSFGLIWLFLSPSIHQSRSKYYISTSGDKVRVRCWLTSLIWMRIGLLKQDIQGHGVKTPIWKCNDDIYNNSWPNLQIQIWWWMKFSLNAKGMLVDDWIGEKMGHVIFKSSFISKFFRTFLDFGIQPYISTAHHTLKDGCCHSRLFLSCRCMFQNSSSDHFDFSRIIYTIWCWENGVKHHVRQLSSTWPITTDGCWLQIQRTWTHILFYSWIVLYEWIFMWE